MKTNRPIEDVLADLGRAVPQAEWDTFDTQARRLELAIKEASTHAISHDDMPAPQDIYRCSLQRIETLLSGDEYYDYDRQTWVDAL